MVHWRFKQSIIVVLNSATTHFMMLLTNDSVFQKGAWHWHKPECAALKRVSPKIPPDFVILLSRVLWKLVRKVCFSVFLIVSPHEGAEKSCTLLSLPC